MATDNTFSRLTELEAQLLHAIELLLPRASALAAEESAAISAAVSKANGLKYTPNQKPFTLRRSEPVIYENESWVYTIKDDKPCLYKHHDYSNTDIYEFDVQWEKVLTWKEDEVRRYKAYLKEHGIKKRVTVETTYFDYTLHVKPKRNKRRKK
jgi:hypothetical protein